MGAPKVPPIIQTPAVSAKPTQAEKDAAKAALDQKKAALGKIQQDVFARSQGLRGAASMYDSAGPTPHLAGDPRAQPQQPTVTPPTVAPPTTQQPNFWGKSNTNIGPVNDFAHNPFPLDPNDARGPRGDRDPQNRTIGGAPVNTGAVPGGPLANRQVGGAPVNTGQSRAEVIAHDPIAYAAADPALAAKLAQTKAAMGLTPKTPTPTPPNGGLPTDPGAAGRAALGLTPKTAPTLDPHMRLADSAVKAAPTTLLPNQGTIAAKLGIAPGPNAPRPTTPAATVPTAPVVRAAAPAAPAAPVATITQRPPTPAAPVTQPRPGSIFSQPAAPAQPARPATVVATLPATLGGGRAPTTPLPLKKITVNTGNSPVLTGRR